ncbi:MAG: zinc dependent phospholipase C family protein [Lachnospiraceae bacterium]
MPGFVTHYLFGQEFISKLDDLHLTHLITEHRNVFNYGLQGPDFFFYYLSGHLLKNAPNPGSAAHEQKTQELFSWFFRSRSLFKKTQELAIADAYLLGHIGHYVLDRNCHPYVYARTGTDTTRNDYLPHHMFLESDVDALLLEKKLGMKPSHFDAKNAILLSATEREVIAKMTTFAYNHTFPIYRFSTKRIRHAMRFMPFFLGFLHDNTGKKKSFVRQLEEQLFHRPIVSPLILSDTLRFYIDPLNLSHHKWSNPWDTAIKSDASFVDLMQKAQTEYTEYAAQFSALRTSPNTPGLQNALVSALGNQSYHSGLSC